MDWPVLAMMFVVFVLGGVVKGMVGFGQPVVVMALLSLLMSPAQAAAALLAPSLASNLWQTRPWPELPRLGRRLAPLLLGLCLGALIGALAWGAPTGHWASSSLGAALLAYAGWGLFGHVRPLSARNERRLGPLAGLLSGLATAATGVFVMPGVPFLQALGLSRDELIQAMGLSFMVATLALAVCLWLNQSLGLSVAGLSLVMILPSLLGMSLGRWLRGRLSQVMFRRCFFVALALLGGHLLVSGLRA